MLFNTLSLYTSLCLISVTIHISRPAPTPKDPKKYDLYACSGVFIGPNTVLTAAHCVTDAKKQWIKTDDDRSFKAVVTRKNIIQDLALLTIPAIKQHEYVSFGRPLVVTDKVYTVNSGDGYERTYNEGYVNNFFEDDLTQTLMILHSATIFQGASGSGLFNSRGELVGINTETVRTLSGAVDLTVIKEFLKIRD